MAESTTRNQSFWSMFELLTRHGVEWQQARDLAINTFKGLDIDFVAKVLALVIRPSPEYLYFQSAENDLSDDGTKYKEEDNFFRKWWPNVYKHSPTWISPPREMVVRSARGEGVLCVNVKGEWSLRSDGYVALSHVWKEGLQRVGKHCGFEKGKLLKVFELLKRANIESEWIWTDVLVIPGEYDPTSPEENKVLTADLINSMATVYGQAEAVLVIDALVLQLHSLDTLEVAIALACGKWATRVWTYQEIKLANRAVIVTATGGIEFMEMNQRLSALEAVDHARYRNLHIWGAIMTKSNSYRLSLLDLVTACAHRSASEDIDYARAFFPVLGLTWDHGMTQEEGMQKIYQSFPKDAMKLAPLAGATRLRMNPGWAPSCFRGLEGGGHHNLEWKDRGIYGEWHVAKINSLVSKTRPIHERIGFNVRVGADDVQAQFRTFPGEPSKVIGAVEKMIGSGKCWLLSVTSLVNVDLNFARTVLLVEEANTRPEHGMEVAVHCAASFVTPALAEEKRSLLIRHGNPNEVGGLVDLVKYHWFVEEEAEQSQQKGEDAM